MKSKLMLLAVVLAGIALRAWGTAGKTVISHDEAISYLGATGNLGRYQAVQDGGAPGGEWATTADWQSYLTIHSPLPAEMQTIARDQAEFDIHPPLYFWLLHIWVRLWGVSPGIGPSLNIIFFLIGAPALFGLARFLLGDVREALVVTLVWAVSPGVLRTAAEGRQYDLLGVLAILFVWLLAVCLDRKRPVASWLWLLLGIVTAAGNLTHYHFVLVAAGGFLVFGWRQVRHNGRFRPTRPLLTALGVVAAGYFISFLLHPAFLTSFEKLADRQVDEATFFLTPLDVMRRIYAAVDTFTGFWVYGPLLQVAIFILFLSGIAFAGLTFVRNRQRLVNGLKQVNWAGYQALLLFLWLGGISILMYLTFISPIHAMTSRHMAAVWPFYAFLAVFLVRVVQARWKQPRLNQYLTVGLATWMVLSGALSVWQTNSEMQSKINGLDILETSPALLVDTVHRGVLPQLLIHVPPSKRIFAAWQIPLLEQPDDWLVQLPDGALYLSDGAYGNTAAGQDQILALLMGEFTPQPVESSIPGIGTVYLLHKN